MRRSGFANLGTDLTPVWVYIAFVKLVVDFESEI
jgi:hypothetical protein